VGDLPNSAYAGFAHELISLGRRRPRSGGSQLLRADYDAETVNGPEYLRGCGAAARIAGSAQISTMSTHSCWQTASPFRARCRRSDYADRDGQLDQSAVWRSITMSSDLAAALGTASIAGVPVSQAWNPRLGTNGAPGEAVRPHSDASGRQIRRAGVVDVDGSRFLARRAASRDLALFWGLVAPPDPDCDSRRTVLSSSPAGTGRCAGGSQQARFWSSSRRRIG